MLTAYSILLKGTCQPLLSALFAKNQQSKVGYLLIVTCCFLTLSQNHVIVNYIKIILHSTPTIFFTSVTPVALQYTTRALGSIL